MTFRYFSEKILPVENKDTLTYYSYCEEENTENQEDWATDRNLPIVEIEIKKENIYIFEFNPHDRRDQHFSLACFTLDEALHTFCNMFPSIKEFTVSVK